MQILIRNFTKAVIVLLMSSLLFALQVRIGIAAIKYALPVLVSAPFYKDFSVDDHGQVTITGKADPLNEVDLVSGTKLLGHVQAEENGNFTIVLHSTPNSGEYRYVLRATDKNGQSATSIQTLIVGVNIEGNSHITAIIDEPNGTQRVVYPLSHLSVEDNNSTKHSFFIEYIAYDNGHFTVCGTAPANRRVNIYSLDLILGSEFIKNTGHFCIERTNRLSEGEYAFKAQLMDEKGQVFENLTLSFKISNLNRSNEQYYIANKPVQTVVVRPGETLSQLAQRVYGDYNFVDKIYQFNKHVLKNPNNVQAGQRLALPSNR